MTTPHLNVIAIDPGEDCGIAFFHQGILQAAWCMDHARAIVHVAQMIDITPPGWQLSIPHIVSEKPVIYPVARTKVDPNGLITLAIKAGGFLGLAAARHDATSQLVEPATWKRQLDKGVAGKRIWRSLTDAERDNARNLTILSKEKAHNAVDAIGIGLHVIGRSILG